MNSDFYHRYSRHIVLPGFGLEGQRRLAASSVLIVGAGGLGSPAAMYLAAAGVGRIGIVDADVVALSNLQRQVIHATADVGRPKVESARQRMLAINPDMVVEPRQAMLTADNAAEMIGGYDFIIDATDNFAAKFAISDACVRLGKPFSYGGVLRYSGQTLTHLPGTACLRCVYGAEPPAGTLPTNEEAGVLGTVVGMLGTLQATEAIKVLARVGQPLAGRLLTLDALTMQFQAFDVSRDAACTACSKTNQQKGL